MASSFSTNLGVEVMASGEKSGAWGDITNLNLNILDRVVSYGELTASDTTTDLTIRLGSPTSEVIIQLLLLQTHHQDFLL